MDQAKCEDKPSHSSEHGSSCVDGTLILGKIRMFTKELWSTSDQRKGSLFTVENEVFNQDKSGCCPNSNYGGDQKKVFTIIKRCSQREISLHKIARTKRFDMRFLFFHKQFLYRLKHLIPRFSMHRQYYDLLSRATQLSASRLRVQYYWIH